MKVFTLIIITVMFLTDAMEITAEDINSPLLSYLLAKVQRLEAKNMFRPTLEQLY